MEVFDNINKFLTILISVLLIISLYCTAKFPKINRRAPLLIHVLEYHGSVIFFRTRLYQGLALSSSHQQFITFHHHQALDKERGSTYYATSMKKKKFRSWNFRLIHDVCSFQFLKRLEGLGF